MSRFFDKISTTWSAATLGSHFLDKLYIAYVWLWYPLRRRLGLAPRGCRLHISLYGTVLTVSLDGSHEEFLIFHEILVREEYKVKGAIGDSVHSIFDIGANIGLVSLYYSTVYKDAKIHCFEPNPQLFPRLCAQVAQCPNVTPHQVALGGTTGPITFYVNEGKSIASSTVKRPDMEMKPFTVDCLTFDDVCRRIEVPAVDIVQFDIEGAEYDMIRSSMMVPKAQHLIGEVHEDLMGHTVTELQSLLPHHHVLCTPGRKVGRYMLSATRQS
jgi:FkbM family methyltransferase